MYSELFCRLYVNCKKDIYVIENEPLSVVSIFLNTITQKLQLSLKIANSLAELVTLYS